MHQPRRWWAVLAGYKQAVIDGADVIVKMDGDGQMDPGCYRNSFNDSHASVITPKAIAFTISKCTGMPAIRIFGNAALSFFFEIVDGLWIFFDRPTGTRQFTPRRRGCPSKKSAEGIF